MKDFSEKIASLSMSDAIAAIEGENTDDIMLSVLKLQAVYNRITPALEAGKKKLERTSKETGPFEYEAKIGGETIRCRSGNVSISKQEIDFNGIRADKGIAIRRPDNKTLVISVQDADDWRLFKTPALVGNPSAVEAAVDAGQLDGKYIATKVTEKVTTVVAIS